MRWAPLFPMNTCIQMEVHASALLSCCYASKSITPHTECKNKNVSWICNGKLHGCRRNIFNQMKLKKYQRIAMAAKAMTICKCKKGWNFFTAELLRGAAEQFSCSDCESPRWHVAPWCVSNVGASNAACVGALKWLHDQGVFENAEPNTGISHH